MREYFVVFKLDHVQKYVYFYYDKDCLRWKLLGKPLIDLSPKDCELYQVYDQNF